DGGLIGLGAAAGEKRFLQPPWRDLRQFLRQAHLWPIRVECRHMLHFVGLLIDRFGYLVVAVADADRENTAEEIEKLLAVGIVDVLIFGVIDYQRLVVIGRDAREK